MRRAGRAGAAWATVKEVSGGAEGLGPKTGRHGRMNEQSANPVVECAENTLGLAVLLTRVRAGKAEMSAMASEETTSGGVVKFAPIVSLQCEDGELKLCLHISKELKENLGYFRLVFDRKRPYIMRVIIEDN